MKTHKVRISLFTKSIKTLTKFKKNCENEGIKIISTFGMEYETMFLLVVPKGRRIFLPCGGEIDLWKPKVAF